MPDYYEEPTQFKRIEQCFIRKGHPCGKYLGASKSCFIACPSTDEVKVLTGLISEKLAKNGIEPVVAVDIRAYGQDIFCTKICGKIIESQFCVALLDDSQLESRGKIVILPNPNVYYEYGIMTSLGKYVIPLQKDGQELAFNIKTHDTIRYSPGDVSAEIDKALKAAIKFTVEERESQLENIIPEYMYHSFLAMKGFQKQGYSWLLSDDVEGTIFSGYKNDTTSEFLLFTVIDNKEMLKTCLIDIQVIQRRLNSDCSTLENRIKSFNQNIERYQQELSTKQPSKEDSDGLQRLLRRFDPESEIRSLKSKIQEESIKLESITNSKFGVILNPDLIGLKEKCLSELQAVEIGPRKWPVYFGDMSGINIGGIEVTFKGPEL